MKGADSSGSSASTPVTSTLNLDESSVLSNTCSTQHWDNDNIPW